MTQISIISENNFLETLLKQHYKENDVSITSSTLVDEKFDIIINDCVNVNIKAQEKTWLLNKPISITNLIGIIDQALDIFRSNLIKIGDINFYPKERLCRDDSKEIPLTQKECEIILYLHKQASEVSKQELLNAVWGYSEAIATNTLETHIYKLRNKFDKEIIIYNNDGYFLARQ